MRTLIFLLFLIVSFPVSAQFNNLRNYSVTLIPEKEASLEVDGDPFFESSDFQKGVVKVGENELNVFLRYDVGAERMEIKTDLEDPSTYQLPYERDIEYHFGGNTFSIDKLTVGGQTVFGYFIKYFQGSSVSLYGKPIASYIEGQKAKTGYQSDEPPSIKITQKFYVLFEDEVKEVRPRKSDLRKIFQSGIVRDYLKENSMKNLDDLLGFIRYYENHM